MTATKKLDSQRHRIASLQSEIATLKAQPLCQAEAEQRVSAMVETLARQFDGAWLGQQIAGPGHIDLQDNDLLGTAAAGDHQTRPHP